MTKREDSEGRVRIQTWLTREERALARLAADRAGKSLTEWVAELIAEKVSPEHQKG